MVEAHEVIDSNAVETLQSDAKPTTPPVEVLPTVRFPAIMRMTPQLSIGGKAVGWNTRHDTRTTA
jgi:hypothetical protein